MTSSKLTHREENSPEWQGVTNSNDKYHHESSPYLSLVALVYKVRNLDSMYGVHASINVM